MKTIFKYPFEIAGVVSIEMPRGAQILTIQTQDGIPTMWARVDTENELVQRLFRIFGTGQEMSDRYMVSNHLATFQQGIFVWHVFTIG